MNVKSILIGISMIAIPAFARKQGFLEGVTRDQYYPVAPSGPSIPGSFFDFDPLLTEEQGFLLSIEVNKELPEFAESQWLAGDLEVVPKNVDEKHYSLGDKAQRHWEKKVHPVVNEIVRRVAGRLGL